MSSEATWFVQGWLWTTYRQLSGRDGLDHSLDVRVFGAHETHDCPAGGIEPWIFRRFINYYDERSSYFPTPSPATSR